MSDKRTTSPPPGVTHATVNLDALTPHPRNYRSHPESQIARLGASLARFGQVRSIVVQAGADGRYLLVAGHGLAEAARREGRATLEADVIPTHWTAAEIEAYLIADNELSRGADDDLTQLAAMLEEQRAAGFDLQGLGFSDDDLAALLDGLGDTILADAEAESPALDIRDLDEVPPLESVARRVSPGDVWRLGAHRLWCGDATDARGVLGLCNGEQPSAAFVDPPFEMRPRQQAEAVLAAFACQAPNVALWTAMVPAIEVPAHVRGNGYRFSHLLVWDRGEAHRAARAREHHNPLISLTLLPIWRRDGVPAQFDGARGLPFLESLHAPCERGFPQLLSVSRRADSEHEQGGEYTKPVALVAALYAAYGLDGPVLDLFSGAGAGFLAATRTRQTVFGVELDPRRCDVALARYEALTGQTPVKL